MKRRRFLTAALGLPLVGAPLRASAQDGPAKIRELYEKDQSFSAFARRSEDGFVTFDGYMAPPLKADTTFFVLTKMPMAVCPFCETSAEWPDDILAVYAKRRVSVIPFNVKIEARGRLELGEFRDPETGFVSMVRLVDATYG